MHLRPDRGGTRAADAALSAKDAAAETMLDRIKDLIFKVLSWVLPASTLAELRVLYHIAMHPIRGSRTIACECGSPCRSACAFSSLSEWLTCLSARAFIGLPFLGS